MATAMAMAAAMSQPTIASDDGLLPGVVDIDGPRTRSARRTPCRFRRGLEIGVGRAWPRPTARIGPTHDSGSAPCSGAARCGGDVAGLRATMTPMPRPD